MPNDKHIAFNDMVRRLRKEIFGKGPERVHTDFVGNMAITIMHGNLTPTEKFISNSPEGLSVVRKARTEMIQKLYKEKVPEGMEKLVGSKLLYLFNDIKVDEDIAVSVFIFEKLIH